MTKINPVYIVAALAVAAGIYIAMNHGDKILDKAGVKSTLKNRIFGVISERISRPDMRALATSDTTATPRGYGKLY